MFYRQVVESNIKPAASMAKRYVNYGVSEETLKQSLLKHETLQEKQNSRVSNLK